MNTEKQVISNEEVSNEVLSALYTPEYIVKKIQAYEKMGARWTNNNIFVSPQRAYNSESNTRVPLWDEVRESAFNTFCKRVSEVAIGALVNLDKVLYQISGRPIKNDTNRYCLERLDYEAYQTALLD